MFITFRELKFRVLLKSTILYSTLLCYPTLLCFVILHYFIKTILWTTGWIFKLQKRFLKILSRIQIYKSDWPCWPPWKNVITFQLSTLLCYIILFSTFTNFCTTCQIFKLKKVNCLKFYQEVKYMNLKGPACLIQKSLELLIFISIYQNIDLNIHFKLTMTGVNFKMLGLFKERKSDKQSLNSGRSSIWILWARQGDLWSPLHFLQAMKFSLFFVRGYLLFCPVKHVRDIFS